MTHRLRFLFSLLAGLLLAGLLRAEDGYRLWLRYEPLQDKAAVASHRQVLSRIRFETGEGTESPTLVAAREELLLGLGGLLGLQPEFSLAKTTRQDALSAEGFAIRTENGTTGQRLVISANKDVGVLYGSFALLRALQTGSSTQALTMQDQPRASRRLLNHWDNLNRTVERGYSGSSIWEWFVLPEHLSPRYKDYARACASIGINGTVLTNVNADALILSPEYLRKVAALASVFRPYGIHVYLTARFSAPMEIGGLKTGDPLDPAVRAWWAAKAAEIYSLIPDFGGFLVKANSEGQPGPQNYGRNHADGANCLADALAPRGGIVLWRAFVYETVAGEDRAKQAYNEFVPLDGKFRDNVVVQIKNGAIDFMPREPFHPLFGSMPKTRLALELQITQEYLGQGTQLCFLAPLYRECLDADTRKGGEGSTVAKIVTQGLDASHGGVIAGVANVGSDRNWTGHPLAAANWYAFGRLAWNPELSPAQLAEEWTRMSFSDEEKTLKTLNSMLLGSWETVVNYSMPLGLHHIMAEGHHYGPGPWFDQGRADWTSVYYHKAEAGGIGFDRTATGSRALEQYHPAVAAAFGSLDKCPEKFLLWFHHVPWDHRMQSGRTLWDELCLRYQSGLDEVRRWRSQWAGLAACVDAERHRHVADLLAIQEREAQRWHNACLQYFQTFSKRPFPQGVEAPVESLESLKKHKIHFAPGNPSGK